MLSMSDKSVHTSDKIIPLVYFILDSSLKTEIFSTGPCGQTTHFLHSLFPGMELAFSLPFTVNLSLFSFYRVPRWYSIKDSACQCRRCKRCRFNPWVGKIPSRRKWHPTPVFLPGNSKDRGAWWAMLHGATKCQTPHSN